MPKKCKNLKCDKKSVSSTNIKGVSGKFYCTKKCMQAAGDEQDSKNAANIKAENDRNHPFHNLKAAETKKQEHRAQFDKFIEQYGRSELLKSTQAEGKGLEILRDQTIFENHPDERLQGKNMVEIVEDAANGTIDPMFLYLGESGRTLWDEAFEHLNFRGSLSGQGRRSRPVLLWSDGSVVTKKDAITILGMESVWLFRDPHKQNAVQIEEALQRHFHHKIDLPSSVKPVGRGWRNVGAGSDGFSKMMEDAGYLNVQSDDIEDNEDDDLLGDDHPLEDDDFLEDGELPSLSHKDDSDEDDDNKGSKGKGLADEDERLHGVYLTYSFKVQELLKSGDLVVDSRTVREARTQQIAGLSSTKKEKTRPPPIAPYMTRLEFNSTMEAATTPVLMVSRSSADEGQQSGEKRPAVGLSDRVDKKAKTAKTQQGLLQFFGQKGKEAMK